MQNFLYNKVTTIFKGKKLKETTNYGKIEGI